MSADYIRKIRTEEGDKQIDYEALANLPVLYPIGSIFVTSDADYRPANKIGGEWTLMDKHLRSSFYDNENTTGLVTLTDSNCSAYNVLINVYDHEAHISISFNLKNSISSDFETNFILGTLDFSKLGFNKSSCTAYSVMATESSNAVCVTTLAYDTGKITCHDIFMQRGNTQINAGDAIRVDFIVKIPINDMINGYCNKFFWKRTA